jgi:hypothetical protein
MAPLMSIAAELRRFIATFISQISNLLKDDDQDVCSVTVAALSKLLEHCM